MRKHLRPCYHDIMARGRMYGWPLTVLKNGLHAWQADRAPLLAAAIAYYAVFALGPLLLISIAMASIFFSAHAAQQAILDRVQLLVGRDATTFLQRALDAPNISFSFTLSTVLGVLLLLMAATGLMNAVRHALNVVWSIEPKPNLGILFLFRSRSASLLLIAVIGLLLLMSAVASAALSLSITYLSQYFLFPSPIIAALNALSLFGIVLLFFALLLRYMPDARIAWRDVWFGAALTSLLFLLGKEVFALYLSQTGRVSAYGVAGSLIALLLWIYYSAQIFLFGAECTKAYADVRGAYAVPLEHAQHVGYIAPRISVRLPGALAKARVVWKTLRLQIRIARKAMRWKKRVSKWF